MQFTSPALHYEISAAFRHRLSITVSSSNLSTFITIHIMSFNFSGAEGFICLHDTCFARCFSGMMIACRRIPHIILKYRIDHIIFLDIFRCFKGDGFSRTLPWFIIDSEMAIRWWILTPMGMDGVTYDKASRFHMRKPLMSESEARPSQILCWASKY